MKSCALIFLLSSFLSAVGDAVLVFAVPVGLGLETRDLRSAVLMWLIPAVAMFASSFLSGRMERRYQSARADYGKLLLGIAALELTISAVALIFRTPIQTIALITGFVFFYALAKEGIPRLLYLVSVYRYFVDQEEYSKIAGKNSGLNILAALVGTCLAGWLVAMGSWRAALLFDATTFVAFGLAMLWFGRDPENGPTQSESGEVAKKMDIESKSYFNGIQLLVPLLFGVNALIWNYLPLLNERLAVLSPAFSIYLIGFLRVPGMVSGLFMQQILKKVQVGRVIYGVPILYLLGSLAFSAFPSIGLFGILVVLQGLVSGAYWPADFTVRNKLSGPALIRFNTRVLRKLAVTQLVGCLLAFWIFSPTGPGLEVISQVAILMIVLSGCYHLAFERRRFAIGHAALVVIFTLGNFGCSRQDPSNERMIILPSVSQNMDLRPDLTYAATAILNDTSAHLVRVSHDLTIQGEVLSKFESTDGGKCYILDLNPEYHSERGEGITADDVAFSIRYYLFKKKELSATFSAIEGSENCTSVQCRVSGIEIQGPYRIRVTLKEPDLRWIEKLASPWLILLKQDRSETEKIGTCVVPYQTGRAQIIGCDTAGVHLHINGQNAVVSSRSDSAITASTLLTESPNHEISPSLTVLAAFANPNSKRLTEQERIRALSQIRIQGRKMASALHLKFAALLTPEWLGVSVPADLAAISSDAQFKCPVDGPVHVLLDTSLPNLPVLKEQIKASLHCQVEFSLTNADTYFQEFAKTDIGIAWFTPDYLDLYEIFAPFDCAIANACSFNWHDSSLQRQIDRVRRSGFLGVADKNTALEIERILLKKGYAAPIAEMNWWIKKSDGTIASIHPAGLFQIRASDFL